MKMQHPIRPAGHRLLITAGLALMAAVTARADYNSTVLSDSPLAFYALNPSVDGTSTAPDLTGNNNTGLCANIAAANGPSPYITNAAYFNGGAAIDLSQSGNPGLLNFTGPITLEAWAQPSSAGEFGDIMAKGYDSSTYQEIYMRVDGPYGAIFDASSGSVGVSGGVQTTNWSYVVLSSDGTNSTLYVNGVQVAQKADVNGSIQFNDDWVIGSGSSAGASGRSFNGNISEVAIYGHGLSSAQVLNHYYYGLLNAPANASVPIINTPPQSQPCYVGETVTLSVAAVSALPMTNQWYFGSTPLSGQTNTTLLLSNLQLTNAGNYTVVVGNANGTTNSVAVLTVTTPRSLQWSANGNNGTWDTSTTANWINLANSQQTIFNPGDQTLFDDTQGVPTSVAVTGNVFPSLVTVNSTTNSYTFNGPGNISGAGKILKEGTNTLTIVTPNGFAGSVVVGGGTVYAGNNCFGHAASLVVSNNSTVDFGGGQFNNLTPVTISGTGYNGQGALINSYGDYPSENMSVTLAGDALFAGTARWDLPSGSSITGAHTLTVDWSADSQNNNYGQWNSVTIGANVVGIVLTNQTSLGMTGMDTGFQNPSTVVTVGNNSQLVFYSGGFNGSIHVLTNGLVYLWTAPAAFNGTSVVLENGAQWQSFYNSGDEPINSAITLNGIAHFVQGDHNEIYTNVISGPGGFVMTYYNHAVILSASNTYAGPTVIGGDGSSPEVTLTGNGSISHSSLIFFGGSDSTVAHLDASGRNDQTLTLASGQTLAGVGGVVGNLVAASGATVSPSGTNTSINITSTSTNAVGTLAASGTVTLSAGSTTILKLDGSGSNDVVQAGANINYGGTLNLVNISGTPLAAGNSFQLFSAANYNGAFSNIVPASPGAGLAWNTSQLSSGILSVVTSGSSGPVISSPVISAGQLSFSISGGSASGTYYILAATNLTGPWYPIATNSYNGSGGASVTLTIPSGTPRQFYQTSSQP